MQVKTWLMIGAVAVFSFSAWADDGNKNNNETSIIGSMPGQMIGGITSGGAPWVVAEGEASISSGGRLHVEVKGLLIGAGGPPAFVGTTGPVKMVSAALVCGGSGGAAAAPVVAVAPSPLSAAGNAVIDQMVTLPTPACLAPVVLVQIFNASTQLPGPFIAAAGLMPGAGEKH